MTLCPCAVVYPDDAARVRGSCAACGGRGVVATPVARGQWDALVAAGWRVDGHGVLRHADYGTARVETALWLTESDKRKAARAAEVRR